MGPLTAVVAPTPLSVAKSPLPFFADDDEDEDEKEIIGAEEEEEEESRNWQTEKEEEEDTKGLSSSGRKRLYRCRLNRRRERVFN